MAFKYIKIYFRVLTCDQYDFSYFSLDVSVPKIDALSSHWKISEFALCYKKSFIILITVFLR